MKLRSFLLKLIHKFQQAAKPSNLQEVWRFPCVYLRDFWNALGTRVTLSGYIRTADFQRVFSEFQMFSKTKHFMNLK